MEAGEADREGGEGESELLRESVEVVWELVGTGGGSKHMVAMTGIWVDEVVEAGAE